MSLQTLGDTNAGFGTALALRPSDKPERYIFSVPDSSDSLFVDFVQCKDPFNLVLEWIGPNDPMNSQDHPGDKKVLYFEMRATHQDGSGGVPDFNIVVIYQYADLSSYMSQIQRRKEMRFGLYDAAGGMWRLFNPGADNSDPPTRVVSQGVSSITDLATTTTNIGLFAENLQQDVLSDWDTTYQVQPNGSPHEYQFSVAGEEDYLWLNFQSQRVPFSFHLTYHDENPASGASLPSGTTGGLVFFDMVIEGRNNVPEGTHCTMRYQYDNVTTSKIHYVRKETLTFAMLKGGQWRPFNGHQQNNIFTSNLIQSTSEILDLNDATTHVGILGEVHDQPINGPDGAIGSASLGTQESGLWVIFFLSAVSIALFILVHTV